jgi:hypothetical protein
MSTVRDEWGIACPKCKSDEHIEIECSIMVRLTQDGTDDEGGDRIWDETSYTRCDNCSHQGKLARFYVDDEVRS